MSAKPDPTAYQANLEAWRLHRGMTQEDVAEKLEVAHTTVGRWERGAMNITSKTLVELCRLYDVSPQQLLSPPIEAAMVERVAAIQGIVTTLDSDAFDDLLKIARRMK